MHGENILQAYSQQRKATHDVYLIYTAGEPIRRIGRLNEFHYLRFLI
ncbi:hypothetical protein [Rufibacter roseolus]|nr:hypothetical protein [Rufibacter roseolus]